MYIRLCEPKLTMHLVTVFLLLGLFSSVKSFTNDIHMRSGFDPCEAESYRHLHDLGRRYKKYKTQYMENEEMVCDKYLIPQHGAWFMAYNDMLTEPPTFLDCGTNHPIWLNGSLPSAEDGVVERTACKVGDRSYCDEQYRIRIKRCDRYTAYFLVPPRHCPEAYCFGQDRDPPLQKPVVQLSDYIDLETNRKGFYFECSLNISSLNFAYYEVTWSWNGDSIKLKNESNQFTNLVLTDKNFQTLGSHITCSVMGLHYEDDTIGPNATSNPFYAGFKFTDSVQVTKGGVKLIPFHLTVPILCQSGDNECNISVTAIDIHGNTDSCQGHLILTEALIYPSQWNKTHFMELKHIGRKGYDVNPSSFELELSFSLGLTTFTMASTVPHINVQVEDSHWDHKICSAHNDPHMTTFDGLAYEHQQPGTYILYEHSKTERHMQVQMELTPCNSNVAYCICGLAVRAGGDLYVIYMCGDNSIFQFASCSNNILRVQRATRNTRQYKITFPSGTEITVNVYIGGFYEGTMNVDIRGTGDDQGTSRGLCGVMTGKKMDGLLIRGSNTTQTATGGYGQKYKIFSDSWRVNETENLFYLTKGSVLEKWTDSQFLHSKSEQSCDRGYDILKPASECQKSYVLNLSPVIPTIIPTPTSGPRKWNRTEAEKFCKKKILETDAFKNCSVVHETNWQNFYDNCVQDIMLTDSIIWADQTLSEVLHTCMGHFMKGTPGIDTSKLCTGNCSVHGDCTEGSCYCHSGYLGIDCSHSTSVPPELTEVKGRKHRGYTWCDRSNIDCRTFILKGRGIEMAGNATCKIEKYLHFENTNRNESVDIKYVLATIESLSEVYCKLTHEQTIQREGLYIEEYYISVSYNNASFSKPMRLNVYKGSCQSLQSAPATNVLDIQPDMCFINGKCISNHSSEDSDQFMICDPRTNQLGWTFDSKNNCDINGSKYHKGQTNGTTDCLSCNPELSSFNWTVKGKCLINEVCFDNWSPMPGNDLYICNATSSTDKWTQNQTLPVPDIRVIDNSQSFELQCYLNTTRRNYTYFQVEWIFENKSFYVFGQFGDLLSMTLSHSYLSKLGIWISCKIEGRDENNETLTTFTSNKFYAGIKTDSIVYVEKGGYSTLKYHFTVPFLCESCTMSIGITDIKPVNGDICGGDIVVVNDTENTVYNGDWHGVQTFTIKHRQSQQYGIPQDSYVLEMSITTSSDTLWNGTRIPDVEVKVIQDDIEWHSKVCSAYTDPHMTTFDGVHYENQVLGTFLLYRNLEREQEVQMSTAPCYNDRAYCTCGITTRAGGDVFMINLCDGNSIIDYASYERRPFLRVAKDKNTNGHYQITMPTGTTVSVRFFHLGKLTFLDVEIRPSKEDVNKTEGLCGKVNDEKSDDFILPDGKLAPLSQSQAFLTSWKIKNEADLFNSNSSMRLTTWTNTEMICSFNKDRNQQTTCSKHLPPSVYCLDHSYETVDTSKRVFLKTGQIGTTYFENVDHRLPPTLTVGSRYQTDMNVTQSYSRCYTYMRRRELYQTCADVLNLHVVHFVEICSLDISLTHSTIWIERSVEILRTRCVSEIKLNSTTPTLLKGNKFCPNSCSGHGSCNDGSCVCHNGYISPDCSVGVTIPPEIYRINNFGICNSRTTDCTTISIFGPIFHETDVFIRLQVFYVLTKGTKSYEQSEIYIEKGKVISLVEVQVDLPASISRTRRQKEYIVKGITVNVGYTKRVFSKETLNFYQYDATCQVPSQTNSGVNFNIADDSCFIDGTCYDIWETNPNNTYEFCEPSRSQYEWSFNRTNVCRIDGTYIEKDSSSSSFICQVCDPEMEIYKWSIEKSKCFIKSNCFNATDLNPTNPDEYCDATLSQTSWTFNETSLIPVVKYGLSKIRREFMHVDVERLYFECDLDMSRLSYETYHVTWLVGNETIKEATANVSELSLLHLTEEHFTVLGTHISCILQGENSAEDKTGTIFRSEPFFAGVEITNLVTVKKGGRANLSYRLTVPFGCLYYNGKTLPCFIELNMLSPEKSTSDKCSGDIVNLQHCRIKIWRHSWNESRSLALKHRGRQMYGVYPDIINMKLKTSSADHPLWDTTKIPEIKVNVEDNVVELQDRVCSAYNGHLTTFDGMHYENQYSGVYTLYRSRQKERNMMVHLYYTPCDDSGALFCICGVAVRAGGDVYVLNFCNGESIIQYVSCQQKLLDVAAGSKDNKKYKITFPTGTEVNIYVSYMETKTFMNVEIRASDDDFNQTEGLCGTLNNICTDDFALPNGSQITVMNACGPNADLFTESEQFSTSWRVPQQDDLFSLQPGSKLELWTNHEEFCTCPSSDVSDEFECSAKSTSPCNWQHQFKQIGDSTCHFTNTSINILAPTAINPGENSTQNTVQGQIKISFEDAKTYCNSELRNNSAFIACSAVPNMQTDYFNQMCQFEVKRSSSLFWLKYTVDSLKTRCLSEVQKNETLDSQSDDNGQSIAETVIMSICPGLPECSGNGRCEKGNCICNKGYISQDCSMTNDAPPVIKGLRGEGLCDRSKMDCDTAFVVGDRIEESDQLSCKITEHVIYQDGSTSVVGTNVVHGSVETLVEAHCPLTSEMKKRRRRNVNEQQQRPFVHKYDVSVGYNAEDFSDPQEIYIFDAACQVQNGSTTNPTFQLKESTCFIEETCYYDGEFNQENEIEFCDVQTSTFEWTFDKSQYCLIEERFYDHQKSSNLDECLRCDTETAIYNWTLASGTCLIDGVCVKHLEKNTRDECLYCDSNENQYQWTRPQEVCIKKVPDENPDQKSTSHIGIIIGSVISGIAFLVVIGILVNACFRNKANKRAKLMKKNKHLTNFYMETNFQTDHRR